jgi:hypothetical protein
VATIYHLTSASLLMDLLLLGTGMGFVGGLMPSALHMIALAQVALNRWPRALLILVGLPVIIDGALLFVTFFFYHYLPLDIAHSVGYVGGVGLIAFGVYSLVEGRRKGQEEVARSATMSYASVSAALLGEFTAPGTWVFWLTIAGPILAEGKQKGYGHVTPFFAGSFTGYYGASILSVWAMAWGASLHQGLKRHLYLGANLLLLVLGFSYLWRAYTGG